MAHSSKGLKRVIKTISIGLIVLFSGALLGFYSLYRKLKDKYIIEKVALIKVCLTGDSLNGYAIEDCRPCVVPQKIGIGITLSKNYVSDENSERMFLSSMEPGIRGIRDSIEVFDICLKTKEKTLNINGLLSCYDFASDLPPPSRAIYEFPNNLEPVTFETFIRDMNRGQRYTSGVRLDGIEKFFWMDQAGWDSIDFEQMEFSYQFKSEGFNAGEKIE